MSKGLTVFAILLIALGVAAYAISGAASVTALIPAFFGVPIAICAVIAAAKPGAARPASLVAAALGLLGVLGVLGRLLPSALKGEFTWSLATNVQVAMALLATALVVWVLLARRGPDAGA